MTRTARTTYALGFAFSLILFAVCLGFMAYVITTGGADMLATVHASVAALGVPIRLTYTCNSRERAHPYDGRWEEEYQRAERAASTCGQECKYDGPKDMARRHAWAKSNAPDIDSVELHVGDELAYTFTS